MRNRKVGSHELNLESSRSHSLMTVHCESSPTDPASPDFGHTRHGKITFVDLAGRCAFPCKSSPTACRAQSAPKPCTLTLTCILYGTARFFSVMHGKPSLLMSRTRCAAAAASERVKDTKSSGDMLKETNNINRSLFTLGKVLHLPHKHPTVLPHEIHKKRLAYLTPCDGCPAMHTLHAAVCRSSRRWQITRVAAPTSHTATRS